MMYNMETFSISIAIAGKAVWAVILFQILDNRQLPYLAMLATSKL